MHSHKLLAILNFKKIIFSRALKGVIRVRQKPYKLNTDNKENKKIEKLTTKFIYTYVH